MRWTSACIFMSFVLFSCKNGDNIPDVSNIKIELSTMRFEKDLFTLDSANFTSQLDQLQAKYPSFGENFLASILNCDPKWSADSVAVYVKGFIAAYKQLFDTAEIIFKDFTPYEQEVKRGLQFVKYYFPNYKEPKKLITNGLSSIFSGYRSDIIFFMQFTAI